MFTRQIASIAFLASLAVSACSSDSAAPSPPRSDGGPADTNINDSGPGDSGTGASDACPMAKQGDLPCDVAAVLEICQTCHTNPPARGAPFPLMRYEDTQEVYFGTMLRWHRMAQVIEPDEPLHMPPREATDVPQPTEAQLTTLRSWFGLCTPPVAEGTGCDKNAPVTTPLANHPR